MPKPDFFIVGAPKSGTTSLSVYLREHPNVFMCYPKEPFYFSTDFPKFTRVKTETDYLNLFSSATKTHYRIGEASVIYLYSKTAIRNIKTFNPRARIIVMLRNPVDLVYSMHSQLLYTREEDVKDFEKAWRLVKDRKRGVRIPKLCRDQKNLYYNEIAKLGNQVERLNSIFPKEQIKIIFFKDFIQDTQRVYREVLDFLELPDDHRVYFGKVNQNKYHKYGWLANFTQRPPNRLAHTVMELKNIFGFHRLGIMRLIRKFNVSETPRKPLPNFLREQIVNEYYGDIVKLSKLTHKDLSSWVSKK